MSLIDPVTNEKYIIGKYLGKGTSSVVHLVTKELDSELYTVKIIDTSIKNFNPAFVQNEINIHIKQKHPNVLNMQLSFFGPDNNKFYIITDYCVNDSLRSLINSRKKLEYPEIRYCIFQLTNGLKYLHANGVMHRDIKLDNILLDSEMNLKIADFGYATTELTSKQPLGTPNYVAPEIILRILYDNRVDIWALGVCIYILAVGKVPFKGTGEGDKNMQLRSLYINIKNLTYTFPDNIDPDFKNLIEGIFTPKNIRLSLIDIENHPFMKNGDIAKTLNYV